MPLLPGHLTASQGLTAQWSTSHHNYSQCRNPCCDLFQGGISSHLLSPCHSNSMKCFCHRTSQPRPFRVVKTELKIAPQDPILVFANKCKQQCFLFTIRLCKKGFLPMGLRSQTDTTLKILKERMQGDNKTSRPFVNVTGCTLFVWLLLFILMLTFET